LLYSLFFFLFLLYQIAILQLVVFLIFCSLPMAFDRSEIKDYLLIYVMMLLICCTACCTSVGWTWSP